MESDAGDYSGSYNYRDYPHSDANQTRVSKPQFPTAHGRIPYRFDQASVWNWQQ